MNKVRYFLQLVQDSPVQFFLSCWFLYLMVPFVQPCLVCLLLLQINLSVREKISPGIPHIMVMLFLNSLLTYMEHLFM